jgi:predicted ATPase
VFVSRLELKNWRNFQNVDVKLRPRMFVVGANASGKSNLLDVFRFLRDIAKPGGGLQFAVQERGGLSPIRCLSARRNPQVEIAVELSEDVGAAPTWRYEIALKQEPRGDRNPNLATEKVEHLGKLLLERPLNEDTADKARLTVASDIREVRELVDGKGSVGDAILPRTNPPQLEHKSFVG